MKKPLTPAAYWTVLALLLLLALEYLYLLAISDGNHLSTIISTISSVILGVTIILPIAVLKNRMWHKRGPLEIIGSLMIIAICVTVGFFLVNTFEDRLAPASIKATLRAHGNVATQYGYSIYAFFIRIVQLFIELHRGIYP